MQTPNDYYRRFHAITVAPPGAAEALATGVRVDRYRLGAQQAYIDERARLARKIKTDLQILRKSNPSAAIRVQVETIDGWEEQSFDSFATVDSDQLWALIRYPYVGKGSPEAIQVALQLACVDLPGSPPLLQPDGIQAYCDRWFGLDCNGFVGNYIRHVHNGVHWSDVNRSNGSIEPNDLISSIWDGFDGVECTTTADVDPDRLNLLVMIDAAGKVIPGGKDPHGHIMISVPGESAQVKNTRQKLPGDASTMFPALCVVESTAAKDDKDGLSGLAVSYYAYAAKAGKPGQFSVLRGLNGGTINVRIKGADWPG
jgi:hypothetical protein